MRLVELVSFRLVEGLKRGGTGACVRCEEAGTGPSARVGLAMSVFTHGVATKDKPYAVNDNQVFPVQNRRNKSSTWSSRATPKCRSPGTTLSCAHVSS